MNSKVITPVERGRGRVLSLVLSILLVATLFTVIPPEKAYAASSHDTIDVSDASHPYTDADEWRYQTDDNQFQIESEDFVIPADYTFEVAEGDTLDISNGKAVTIEEGGELKIDGGSVIVGENSNIKNSGALTFIDGVFTNDGTITNGDPDNENVNASFTIADNKIMTNNARILNATGSAIDIEGEIVNILDITNYGTLDIDKASAGSITAAGTVTNHFVMVNKDLIATDGKYVGEDVNIIVRGSGNDPDFTTTEYTWAAVIDDASILELGDGDEVELEGDDPGQPIKIVTYNASFPGYDNIVTNKNKDPDAVYENLTIESPAGARYGETLIIEDLKLDITEDSILLSNTSRDDINILFRGRNVVGNIKTSTSEGQCTVLQPTSYLPYEDTDTLYASSISNTSGSTMIFGGNVHNITGATEFGADPPTTLTKVEVRGAYRAGFPIGTVVKALVPEGVVATYDSYLYHAPIISEGGIADMWLPTDSVVQIWAETPNGTVYTTQSGIEVDTLGEPIIIKSDIEGTDIEASCPDVEYNGLAQKPEVIVTDSALDVKLIEGVDYDVAYGTPSAEVKDSPVTVTITGKGDYEGATTSTAFNITPRDMSDPDIIVGDIPSVPYGRDNKLPTIYVTDTAITRGGVSPDGVLLTSTADYDKEFADNKYAGEAKVTVSGIQTGTGGNKKNYIGARTTTFDITKVRVTTAGIVVDDKVYDGTKVATLSAFALEGVVPLDKPDIALLPGTPTFVDKNAGPNKEITFDTAKFALTSTAIDAVKLVGSYDLAVDNPTMKASITPLSIEVVNYDQFVTDKIYDGTASVGLVFKPRLATPITTDDVSIKFGTGVPTYNDKNVGTNKPIHYSAFELAGADAGNYTLSNPQITTTLTGAVTAKDISVTNYQIANKVYDGTVTATFAAQPYLSGVIGSDNVIVTPGAPTFASKEVGTNIRINFTPFTLIGADAINYNLTNPQPTDATANIEPAPPTPPSTPTPTPTPPTPTPTPTPAPTPSGDVVKASAVSVHNAPATFRYKASGKNNTLQLSAAVLPSNATNKSVKWTSNKTSVATVNANGLVTFRGAEGEVKITATAGDGTGHYGVATIKVTKNVTKVRTPLTKVYIQKGKRLTIPVALDDSTNLKATINSKLTWKSLKTSVVRVNSKGKITARKKGAAKVRITAANGKSRTITVVVASKATKLTKVTAKFPKSLKKGKTYQLKLKLSKAKATGVKVRFKSSKSSVLKVDKAGKLIALKKGKAKITIKAGSKTYAKTVTVK